MATATQAFIERWEKWHRIVATECTTGQRGCVGSLENAWACTHKVIADCYTDEQALDLLVLWHQAFPYGDLPHVLDCIPFYLRETPQYELLKAIHDFNEARPRDVEDWIELRLSFMEISCRHVSDITHFFARNYEYTCARNGALADDQLEMLCLEMGDCINLFPGCSCFLKSLKQFNESRSLLRTNRVQAFFAYDAAAELLHSWFVSNKSLLGPDDFRVRALATQVYKTWTAAQILFDDEILFNDEHKAQLRIAQFIPSIESQFTVAAK